MASVDRDESTDEWMDVATQELRRLQDEFRMLQEQSHRIMAVAVGIAGIAIGGVYSHDRAGAFALGFFIAGMGFTWYLNVNAESVAVGKARDLLGDRINTRLQSRHGEGAIYSKLVQAAGRNGWSSIFLAVGFWGLLAALGTAMWMNLAHPGHSSGGLTSLAEHWRFSIGLAVTLWSLLSTSLALWATNKGYERRFDEARARARGSGLRL